MITVQTPSTDFFWYDQKVQKSNWPYGEIVSTAVSKDKDVIPILRKNSSKALTHQENCNECMQSDIILY